MTDYRDELAAALGAAAAAARYVLAEYEAFEPIPDAPADISTAIDRGSQDLILKALTAKFPDDGYVGEESTATLDSLTAAGKRVWVIDPIDGTRGFARKNGQFSVMVGLLDASGVALGVVAEPVAGRVTYAVRGGGCWVESGDEVPRPCRVTEVDELGECTVLVSHAKPGRPWPDVQLLQPKRAVETYSAGVKLAAVARGDGDIYLNPTGFYDWDVCAGEVLVTEAGGRITDLAGGPIQYGRERFYQPNGMLATNGRLHDEVIARRAE